MSWAQETDDGERGEAEVVETAPSTDVSAEDNGPELEDKDNDGTVTLPVLKVQALPDNEHYAPTSAEGAWTLTSEHLRNYSKADGNVTPMLESLPNVHFDNERRDSDNLFNLAPPSVSISGGRSYENNFTLDGFSVNSRFDPGNNGSVAGDLPGHDQGLFIDTALLESVTVYQSNVPARYGKFLGGVVDMQTRSYSLQPETSISWRFTRDSMVQARTWQVDDPQGELASKPVFSRDRLTIRHSRPLDEQSGITLALTRATSSRPTTAADRLVEATQYNYNLLAKYQREFDSGVDADLSLTVAPYQTQGYLATYRDSRYDIDGGGLTLGGKFRWVNRHDQKMLLDAGYAWRTSSRSAAPNTHHWVATASKPWGLVLGSTTSLEGSLGDLDRDDHSAFVKLIGEGVWQRVSGREIRYEYGVDVSGSLVSYNRPRDYVDYREPLLTPGIQCRHYTLDCIQNEQYNTERNIYPADDVAVSLLETGAFAEMTLAGKRLESTAGLRVDYNDYTRNVDLAPRSRFSLAVFENRNTLLVWGLNRYYGGALITYKLREARKPYYQETRGATQNIVNDWQPVANQGDSIYRSTSLETPYSDEASAGLRQSLWGGHLSLDIIQRQNRKQFSYEETGVQQDGFKIKRINNEGESEYQSLSLGWARHWANQWHTGFMVSWSRAESSNESYDEEATEELDTHAWYHDARHAIDSLNVLRENFSRPVVASVSLSKTFLERLKTSMTVRYESAYDTIVDSGKTITVASTTSSSAQETLPVYVDFRRPAVTIADLSMVLTPWPRHRFSVLLDVSNIGNARTYTVRDTLGVRGVEVGRNYWLGLEYAF